MMAYIAEFIGTFMLILLGDSVVANVSLNKSGMKGAGTVQITLAWGLAVMVPAFIFGAASGAHFNPALTLALAIDGSMSWSMVPGYVIAQFAGAFLGACVVYMMFKDQFDATEEAGTKLGVFCTGASVQNIPRNISKNRNAGHYFENPCLFQCENAEHSVQQSEKTDSVDVFRGCDVALVYDFSVNKVAHNSDFVPFFHGSWYVFADEKLRLDAFVLAFSHEL